LLNESKEEKYNKELNDLFDMIIIYEDLKTKNFFTAWQGEYVIKRVILMNRWNEIIE
jgi:hypothetical protein